MTQKLTHDVIMDCGMALDPKEGLIRFFSKSRLKIKKEFIGPLVFNPNSVDPRVLNLLIYSPILYQATQRAKLDAMDFAERLKSVAGSLGADQHELAHECIRLLAQVIHLEHAMNLAQEAARDGIDFERVDQFMNMSIEVKMPGDKT